MCIPGANQISHMSLRRQVWTPDTFFYNQKEGKFIDNLGDNTFFRITNNGKKKYAPSRITNSYNCYQEILIMILSYICVIQKEFQMLLKNCLFENRLLLVPEVSLHQGHVFLQVK